ncbi:MAG: hypothetical protein ACLTV6_14790 [Christensenellales bacterium]
MSQPKLLVFMIDALCESDITHAHAQALWLMLENGALVREMLPVYLVVYVSVSCVHYDRLLSG